MRLRLLCILGLVLLVFPSGALSQSLEEKSGSKEPGSIKLRATLDMASAEIGIEVPGMPDSEVDSYSERFAEVNHRIEALKEILGKAESGTPTAKIAASQLGHYEAEREQLESRLKAAREEEAARKMPEEARRSVGEVAGPVSEKLEKEEASLARRRAQWQNFSELLKDPPSETFWSDMRSEERTAWMGDKIPDWDKLPEVEQTKIFRAIRFAESRAQTLEAANNLDRFVRKRDLTPKGLKARSIEIKSIENEIEKIEAKYFNTPEDIRKKKSLKNQLQEQKNSLQQDLAEFSELRDDLIAKSKKTKRMEWAWDENAREQEALRRVDKLAQAKGELALARKAEESRDKAFIERMDGIRKQLRAAHEAGDLDAVKQHKKAFERLEKVQKAWREHDKVNIRTLKRIFNSRRENIAHESLKDELHRIGTEKKLDLAAAERLKDTGALNYRVPDQDARIQEMVDAIDVSGEKFSASGAILDAYDAVKTSAAMTLGMAYGTVKGAYEGAKGAGELFIWEPIDTLGEKAEAGMEQVFGARTNIFGTENQKFIDDAVNNPGKTAEAMFFGLGKAVYDTAQKSKQVAGKLVASQQSGSAYHAFEGSASVGKFIGENILDPTILLGGAGKLIKAAKAAGKAADTLRVADKIADATQALDEVASTSRRTTAASAVEPPKLDLPTDSGYAFESKRFAQTPDASGTPIFRGSSPKTKKLSEMTRKEMQAHHDVRAQKEAVENWRAGKEAADGGDSVLPIPKTAVDPPLPRGEYSSHLTPEQIDELFSKPDPNSEEMVQKADLIRAGKAPKLPSDLPPPEELPLTHPLARRPKIDPAAIGPRSETGFESSVDTVIEKPGNGISPGEKAPGTTTESPEPARTEQTDIAKSIETLDREFGGTPRPKPPPRRGATPIEGPVTGYGPRPGPGPDLMADINNAPLDPPALTRELRFRPNDLVYGPSAGGRLRELQQRAGGRLLTDLPEFAPGTRRWIDSSIDAMEDALDYGNTVHFDLTHVDDLPGVLRGVGPWTDSTTAQELRYLRSNWSRFQNSVKFYRNGSEVSAPW